MRGSRQREPDWPVVLAILAVVVLGLAGLLALMGCELSWELPCRR